MNLRRLLTILCLLCMCTPVFALFPPVFTDPWHTADEVTNRTFAQYDSYTFPVTTANAYVKFVALTYFDNVIDTIYDRAILLNSNVTIYGDYYSIGAIQGQTPRIIRRTGWNNAVPWMAPGIYSNESGVDLYVSTNHGAIQFFPAHSGPSEQTVIFPDGSMRMGYISGGSNITIEKKLRLRLGLITRSSYIKNSTVLCKKTDDSLGVCQNIDIANANCTCV